MTVPVTASERDLRALAAIVSQDRPGLPGGGGLPPSPLADLMATIRCDAVTVAGIDSGQRETWFSQELPAYVQSAPVLCRNHEVSFRGTEGRSAMSFQES